jgi:hypothetical protein
MLISFSTLDDAIAGQAALAGAGVPADSMRLLVREDEAGPTEGNFLIGNGRTTHGGPPDAVRTGPEVPYEENFRDPTYRGGFLLALGELDERQRAALGAVLQRFDAVDVEEVARQSGATANPARRRDVADPSGPSGGALTRDHVPEPAPERAQQAPLGDHPDYDDVLDVAVQYTFPCSDPIAVDSCCAHVKERGSS